jgi:hypothetical protein
MKPNKGLTYLGAFVAACFVIHMHAGVTSMFDSALEWLDVNLVAPILDKISS